VPRKFFRRISSRYLPEPEVLRRSRMVAWCGTWLHHPNLWHLNRRSVPGAVAIGLFSGLVPGPLQMLTALLLAIPCRKNIPVALIVTLYTNPFTIVPLYVLAYAYGRLLLPGEHGPFIHPFEMNWSDLGASWRGLLDWMMALGKPLGVGLIALGLTLAALGYVVTYFGWRAYVVAAWRARARRRTVRA
jgi:uncharacterized protein (DUF2062 family)